MHFKTFLTAVLALLIALPSMQARKLKFKFHSSRYITKEASYDLEHTFTLSCDEGKWKFDVGERVVAVRSIKAEGEKILFNVKPSDGEELFYELQPALLSCQYASYPLRKGEMAFAELLAELRAKTPETEAPKGGDKAVTLAQYIAHPFGWAGESLDHLQIKAALAEAGWGDKPNNDPHMENINLQEKGIRYTIDSLAIQKIRYLGIFYLGENSVKETLWAATTATRSGTAGEQWAEKLLTDISAAVSALGGRCVNHYKNPTNKEMPQELFLIKGNSVLRVKMLSHQSGAERLWQVDIQVIQK